MVWRPAAAAACLMAWLSAPAVIAEQNRAALCGSIDRTPADLARLLAPLGEPGRTALLTLAQSPVPGEVLCGVAGLSALGDRRVIPSLVSALRQPALREDAYRLARWAAHLAGGAEPGLGAAMRPVVEALADHAIRTAAGDDAIWLLGEVDDHSARDRLLAELSVPRGDASLDAVVHALARQGDARARAPITALGVEAARAKSGNATPEQARRLAAVAFYQLALGPETIGEGLTTLDTVPRRDQEDTAAWAVQTLCARAARRPSERAVIEAHRKTVAEELDRLGLAWDVAKGPLGCARR
jgi:hypothetical protein